MSYQKLNTMRHQILKQKRRPISTPKQRLAIYKEMLDLVNGEDYHGLCVGLMELSGRDFVNTVRDTDKVFPEFGKHIDTYMPKTHLNLLNRGQITQEWRLAVLKDCIKQCNDKILK